MDARLDATVGEAPAQAVVTALAGRARWFDPPWPARQPRVEHHPLTDFEPTRLGPQLHHVGDHLVAHDLRERAEGGQGVVGVLLAEVEQDLLGVRPADARQPRPGDHPIRSQRPWICQLAQRRRGAGQVARQRVRRLIDLEWLEGYAVNQGFQLPDHGRRGGEKRIEVGILGIHDVLQSHHLGQVVLEAVAADGRDDALGHQVGRNLGPAVERILIVGPVPDFGVDGTRLDQSYRDTASRQVDRDRLTPAAQRELTCAIG